MANEPKYTHADLEDLVHQLFEAGKVLRLLEDINAADAFDTAAECLTAVINGKSVDVYVREELEKSAGDVDAEVLAMFDAWKDQFGEGEC